MKEEWQQRLNFQIKKISKFSNPNLCFIIVHKPYKLSLPSKFITPEVVPTYGEKPSPVVEKLMQGQRKNSSTKKIGSVQNHQEGEFDKSSSIGASPIHDGEQNGEVSQSEYNKGWTMTVENEGETNTNQQSFQESRGLDQDSAQVNDWNIEQTKAVEYGRDREQRLMCGEDDGTLNGKRDFDTYEKIGDSWGSEGFHKEVENEDGSSSWKGAEPIKKLKVEEPNYKDLLQSLQNLDCNEIIEIAKGLDKHSRAAVIELLMQLEANKTKVDLTGDVQTILPESKSPVTPNAITIEDSKELSPSKFTAPKSFSSPNLKRSPNDTLSSVQAQQTGLLWESPATVHLQRSMANNLDSTPVIKSSMSPNIAEKGQQINESPNFGWRPSVFNNERMDVSPNPFYRGGDDQTGKMSALTKAENDASRAQYLGRILQTPDGKIPSAAKSDSAMKSNETTEKKDAGSRSVDGKIISKSAEDKTDVLSAYTRFLNDIANSTMWNPSIDKTIEGNGFLNLHAQDAQNHQDDTDMFFRNTRNDLGNIDENTFNLVHNNQSHTAQEVEIPLQNSNILAEIDEEQQQYDLPQEVAIHNNEGTLWQDTCPKDLQTWLEGLISQAQAMTNSETNDNNWNLTQFTFNNS